VIRQQVIRMSEAYEVANRIIWTSDVSGEVYSMLINRRKAMQLSQITVAAMFVASRSTTPTVRGECCL